MVKARGMDEVVLAYPVHTLDGRLLLPAGARLDPETLAHLVSSGATEAHDSLPLLEYGTIRADVLAVIGQGPYRVIFDSEEKVAGVLSVMERVQMASPLLDCIDRFRTLDAYTYLHILRVFALSTVLAQTLVHDFLELSLETTAGPLHDLGKICVPVDVLRKDTPLTRSERRWLEHHTLAGYVLLSYYQQDPGSFLARVAREHHERRDGSGYPLGISLTDQMVEVISVSDIYDALISSRPYRQSAYDNRAALDEIAELAKQGKLGRDVVRALVACNRRLKPDYRDVVLSEERRGRPPSSNLYGVVVEDD